MSQSLPVAAVSEAKQSLLGRATSFFVYLFERIMPDPFVFAVLLTFVGAVLARLLAPDATASSIASAWYGGVFTIFAFAFQMVIMLVAGYALAVAPPVQRVLARIAGLASTPLSAISVTVIVGMIASWVNWGAWFGDSSPARRRDGKALFSRLWLVGCRRLYRVCGLYRGLSGSIALSQATHGSALNSVEKVTGHGLPVPN